MINACWYYHPEQTVHRFDKHFYEHEVAKSGQYRDHPIESVLDKCFVMFHTRFFKGRPRGFPPGKSVYVCESRYNEDQRCFRKIKTWASCVPDEVRSKDYEMDLFPMPLSNVKVPSPIKHLVRSDATETSELPKPTWGDKHSPPIVGAAHRRPRDPKVSRRRCIYLPCVCVCTSDFALASCILAQLCHSAMGFYFSSRVVAFQSELQARRQASTYLPARLPFHCCFRLRLPYCRSITCCRGLGPGLMSSTGAGFPTVVCAASSPPSARTRQAP